MNGWNNNSERESQMQYGRSQISQESDFSHRPIGYENNQFDSMTGRNHHQQQGLYRSQVRQQVNSRQQTSGEVYRERGHMAFLKALQRTGSTIRLVSVLGDEVIGTLKDCDESTITVRVTCKERPDAYQNRVFIKQNIIEFAPVVDGVTFS